MNLRLSFSMANKQTAFPRPVKEGHDPDSILFVEDFLRLNGIDFPVLEPESDIPADLTIDSVMAIRLADDPPFALAHDYGVKEAVIEDVLEYRKARHAGGPSKHEGFVFGLHPKLFNRSPEFKQFARGVASYALKLLSYDLYMVFMEIHGHTPASMSELEQEKFIEFPTAADTERYRDFIRGCFSTPRGDEARRKERIYRRRANALLRTDI